MKRLQLSLLALAVAGAATAQRTPGTVQHAQVAFPIDLSGARVPTDTLVPAGLADDAAALALYLSSGTGYIVGTNNFADKAKVQVFNSTGTVMVEQLLFLFGARNDNNAPNSPVHARVYGLDASGTTSTGTVNTAPGTVLGNVDIPISGCDTAGMFTVASFSPAISVNGNFGGGFDVADLAAGVEIGLFSTEDGGPGTAPDMNWEKFSDDTWFTLSNTTASWGVQLDFAILAVLGDGVAGIDDAATVNGMRMSFLGANPASTEVVVAYDMLQDANTRLMVMDMKGAKVMDQQLGRTSTGRHQTTLNVSDWANGTYYVSLFANGGPITKKLVVKH